MDEITEVSEEIVEEFTITKEEMIEIEEPMEHEITENQDKFAGIDLDALLASDEEDEDAVDDVDRSSPNDIQEDKMQGAAATKLVQLPLSRIKQIIKLDSDVDRVTSDAVFVIAKATELFLETFAKEIYKFTARSKKKTVQMRDVTACIDDVCCMQFLEGVFPNNS